MTLESRFVILVDAFCREDCRVTRSPRLQPGDRSYPDAPPPPVPIRAVLSARSFAALSGRFPAVFGADLLTGRMRRGPRIALWRPILSRPPDLGVLVRPENLFKNKQLLFSFRPPIRSTFGWRAKPGPNPRTYFLRLFQAVGREFWLRSRFSVSRRSAEYVYLRFQAAA
jgi:hypothetical protein